MTRVKICGITEPSELFCALDLGPDAVGFVVEVEGSRHRISAREAKAMIKSVPVFTKSVAVISPKSLEDAVRLADQTRADIMQVHGSLSPGEIMALKGKISQKVVAAVPSGSLDMARKFSEAADAVLLDTFKDGVLGGSGTTHDWSMSREIIKGLKTPVILAGGLNPSNVARAISLVGPYAVDVSSGVETSGKKDPDKVAAFVKAVRSCL
jgi:phosphoribosylanthranilate isomerase